VKRILSQQPQEYQIINKDKHVHDSKPGKRAGSPCQE
jgi:hypothetical protein